MADLEDLLRGGQAGHMMSAQLLPDSACLRCCLPPAETLEDFGAVQPQLQPAGLTQAPPVPQPMGLGSKLPSRGTKHATAGASSGSSPEPQPFTVAEPAADNAAPRAALPPNIQELADELLKLVEESGFGGCLIPRTFSNATPLCSYSLPVH